jgi:hypothetical protein
MAIGFEMRGTGSHNFRWSSGAWTEGSLAFVRLALAAGNSSALGVARSSQVGAIRDAFAAPKYHLVREVANLGLKVRCAVSGDVHFVHQFDPAWSGEAEFSRLMWRFDEAGLREQVVIHLCKCVLAFRQHVLFKDHVQNGAGLWMFVVIDL